MARDEAECKPGEAWCAEAPAISMSPDDIFEPNAGKHAVSISSGSILRLHGIPHRIIAYIEHRVLATDLRVHVPFLIQEEPNGPLKLPPASLLEAMLLDGRARAMGPSNDAVSPTERMRAQIETLDAAGVPQGEKAIWIHLARHWTPDLVAAFGPHDDPCKIKRWRAALRRAAR